MTFGYSSSLERIGAMCFDGCSISEFEIPASLRVIGTEAFGHRGVRGFVCRDGSCFRAIGGLLLSDDFTRCFYYYYHYCLDTLSSVRIPDGVRDLCDGCFRESEVVEVEFGPSSSLERIGVSCFQESLRLEEFAVPDSVRELCDCCFKGCESLRRVTFGPSSSLERIGVEAFGPAPYGGVYTVCAELKEIDIPDSVRELGDGCFRGCCNLSSVTFGPSSSLERIGVEAFADREELSGKCSSCGLGKIDIPDSVRELGDRCFSSWCGAVGVTFGASSSLERIGFDALLEAHVRMRDE